MEYPSLDFLPAPRPVRTVLGDIPYQSLGVTDAHNHVWIDPVPGAHPSSPTLFHYEQICAELKLYRAAGGQSLLDCQPAGCGRNAQKLAQLAVATGVNLVACTGFHRQRYYAPQYWLFSATAQQALEYFLSELNQALGETNFAKETGETRFAKDQPAPVRAGFIKIALESAWDKSPQAALEGVAEAARQTGALLAIHTEQGRLAEKAVIFFEARGLTPAQLMLCHMDKRPDIGLHKELARFGVLLEYDTFYRPKYEPESRLWPLIQKMAHADYSRNIALATDMAEADMYRTIGNGPGLASLPGEIKLKLSNLGISENSSQQMLGGNIARRLAGLD